MHSGAVLHAGPGIAETRPIRGLALALPLFILIVFLPAFSVSFAQDDFSRLNRGLQGGYWRRDFLSRFARGMNRPVLEAYFELLIQLFGVSITAFHLVGFALHTLNAYLLARLARTLGSAPSRRSWPPISMAVMPRC